MLAWRPSLSSSMLGATLYVSLAVGYIAYSAIRKRQFQSASNSSSSSSPPAVVAGPPTAGSAAVPKRYDPSRAKVKVHHVIHFACGCFWSVEIAFQRVLGVYETSVGYTQGSTLNPTYEDVKRGGSGHVEAVKVTYDPQIVTLETLLDVFWKKHDPTSKDKQGGDKGTQYRSGIYYTDADLQLDVINSSLSREKALRCDKPWKKIHTEIKPAETFYPAEDYHQKYLSEKGGRHGNAQSATKGCSDPIRCYG